MHDEARQLIDRIQAAMDFMLAEDSGAAMMPWLCWQADNIFDHIAPEDFTPIEMVTLVGLCGPIFARTLAPSTPPKGLPLRAVS